MRKNHVIIIVLLALMVTFVGCSASGGSEKDLRKKIALEWQAKMNKDWGVVYDLAADAYKEKVDRTLFIQKANVNVQEFSIQEVKITESGKKALAVVDYRITQKGFDFKTTSKETWVWENGDWRLDLDLKSTPKEALSSQ